jgi:hypothetical protein
MLLKPWKTVLIDVSKFAFLDKLDKKPESKGTRAVHEELSYDEVHALDVISLVIVASKGGENFAQLFLTGLSILEIVIFRESSR